MRFFAVEYVSLGKLYAQLAQTPKGVPALLLSWLFRWMREVISILEPGFGRGFLTISAGSRTAELCPHLQIRTRMLSLV
jgi:hypothetical protein